MSYTCKFCGESQITFLEDSLCVCDSCGSSQTLSELHTGAVNSKEVKARGFNGLPKKILVGAKNTPQERKTPIAEAAPQSDAAIEQLIRFMFVLLKNKSWQEADDCCEEILKSDSECAPAYLGKLMAECRVPDPLKLHESKTRFDNHPNYEKAMQFGDDDLKKSLEESRLEWVYRYAIGELYQKGKYDDAVEWFESIKGYKDADKRAQHCASVIQDYEAHNKKIQKEARAGKRANHTSLKATLWVVPIVSFAVFTLVFLTSGPNNVISLLAVPIIIASFWFLWNVSSELHSSMGHIIAYVLVIIETAMGFYLYYNIYGNGFAPISYILCPVILGCAVIQYLYTVIL